MSLVRWLRKNNKKVMAVVVIGIMFIFIGGGTLLEHLSRRRTETLAYFADKRKITNNDFRLARGELDILRTLRADILLRNQNLGGIFLCELLFAEQRTSPVLINHIKQTIRANRFRISDKQINDIYNKRGVPPSIYWLLLKNETQLAGLRVPNEESGELLGRAIPQLFNGQTYSQRIRAVINQHGIPEEQILTIFGKLLAVWQYSQMLCVNEDITGNQITQTVAAEQEKIDVEFVEFDSAVFTSGIENPTPKLEQEHFDKYKKFLPSEVSEENPYGFGYKLPDRVQLEYIVVRLDDVRTLIKPPTNQEKEDYYNRYREQLFTEELPSDPNNPNSPMSKRIKSYAEVTDIISARLLKNKIDSTALRILQEAKTIIEAPLGETETESADLTAEQLKKLVGVYKTTAEQLSKKYNIRLYEGSTGLLNPTDIQTDKYLSRLYLEGYGQNPVSLAQIVFAIDDLAVTELGPFDVPKPRMYENIGPFKDLWGSPWSGIQDISGQITAVVRVVKAIKATEPESLEQTFSTSSLQFDPNQEASGKHVYSVKEKVIEDLKKLAAMDIAKRKAEEFIDLAAKEGWDSTIDKFNERYGRPHLDPNDPNTPGIPNAQNSTAKPFKLQNLTGLQRILTSALETLAAQQEGKPAGKLFLYESKNHRRFIEQLYSLIPQDANTVDTVPLVMEFKPDMSFYCIKNISIKRLSQQDYEKSKAIRLQQEDYIQSESLAADYFNPENILKRMNFRFAKQETPDANTPAETEAAS